MPHTTETITPPQTGVLYLIHATGWAQWSLSRLRQATPAHRAQFRREYQDILVVPDGAEEQLDIGSFVRIVHILDDPQKCQLTPYWMSGTEYQIRSITPGAAAELRAVSAQVIQERLDQEQAEIIADARWTATMGKIVCPACGTVCYGDCRRSPLYR
jgi:hypothetical protein